MKTCPMLSEFAGRDVVIVGGGEAAARKARLLPETEARLILASPGLDAELSALVAADRARHHPGPPDADVLRGAARAFVATGCRGADAAVAELARSVGVLAETADASDPCDGSTSVVVDRGPEAAAGDLAGRGAGFVSLVGAGPGSRDLMTLRAVRRLQEADVVFYDRLVDPEALDLARSDAGRVYVGKVPGAHAWPQARINDVLVAAAREGKRVVRLKCGDPGVFGRGAEEAAALDAAGIAWEIVPGVTAACAAAAEAGAFLTERGHTDTVVLCTAQVRAGDVAPDWARHAAPGATLAFYMPTASGAELQRALLAGGVAPDAELEIVSRAATPRARVLRSRLDRLGETLAAAGPLDPAIVLLRLSKAESAQTLAAAAPRPVLAAVA